MTLKVKSVNLNKSNFVCEMSSSVDLSHLEVIGRGRAEAPHTVQVLQLQVVRHCNTQTQNLIRMSKER